MIKVSYKYLLLFLFISILFSPKHTLGATEEDIQRVADNLVIVTGREIDIVIINSIEPDAYLHPMGHIVITKGLMKLFKGDAEIAFILGHELAHITMEHYKNELDILGIAPKEPDPSYDKLQKEMEADAYGLIYMKSAGYEPAASLKVLKSMLNAGMGGRTSINERINAISNIMSLGK